MKKWIIALAICMTITAAQAQTNVIFYTTEGNFLVEIHDDVAPITGGNFLDLVGDKFYDGVIFHRVIDNFIIQGGDPTGTGTGGPGYTIDDEFAPSLSNIEKTISMANSGPNTGGSQFFFNMVNNTFLDHDQAPLSSAHPVFGTVVENWNVVEAIESVPVNGSNRPIDDVVIDSIRLEELPTGLKDESLAAYQIKVYPNPINTTSVISITAENAETGQIQLFDSLGKLIATLSIDVLRGTNQVNLAPLLKGIETKGIYHLHVSLEQGIQTIRVTLGEG